MVFKYLRSIPGAIPEYCRAPKTALEREIWHRLDRLPHVAMMGNWKSNGGGVSSSAAS